MTSFDYDVLIVGSGFGGSVAALRAAEKGYLVGVLESGKRWNDADIPKSQWHLPGFLWFPAADLYGIQRVEYLRLWPQHHRPGRVHRVGSARRGHRPLLVAGPLAVVTGRLLASCQG
jgi:choline dehydrogenase-like flavoprotein